MEETRKVGVHTLVTADQLIRESQTGHETTLLEPKDGSEGAGEEDTLDGRKGNETLSEGGTLVRDPAQSPVSLLLDARDRVDGIEEVLALLRVFDVGVDEQRVCLRVDVLPNRRKGVTVSFVISIPSRTLYESRRL